MATNKKQICVTMRATKIEHQTLKELANGLDIPMSDLIRFALSLSWDTLCNAELEDIEKWLHVPFYVQGDR
jgi:hypothetical protein